MRETKFIEQNKSKWQDFEKVLEGEVRDPEKLNNLFIQITDDLSYSRTFYSNRSVRVYLNGIAQRVFFSIYRSRQSPLKKVGQFWYDELPRLIYASRKEFRLSFWVFVLAMAIGAFSCAMDPEYITVVLGEDYVNMTVENIESGDPMAVYKQKGAFTMSFGITFNNLYVAFLTFVFGVLFGIGTVLQLLSNGIMVGAFQYFFIEEGLFLESFLTIWTHGTLEISAIIISGAAGLTMGRGLLFPGTYTRLQAFQKSARRGLKIMIGIAPVIVLAGFIEGYLTRFTETPDLIRGFFIFCCLLIVLIYFVWYPRIRAVANATEPIKDQQFVPHADQVVDTGEVKSSGDIFSDIFVVFREKYKSFFTLIFLSTTVYCLLTFSLATQQPANVFYYPAGTSGLIAVMEIFFVNESIPYLFVINTLIYVVLTTLGQHYILQTIQKDYQRGRWGLLLTGINLLMGVVTLNLMLQTNDWYTIFLLVFVFPVPVLFNFIMQVERNNLWHNVQRMSFLLSKNYARILGLFLILLIISLFFFLIVDSSLFRYFFSYVSWIVYLEQEALDQLSVILLTFIVSFAIHTLYLLVVCGIGVQYYTLREIKEAPVLRQRIKEIGKSQKIQGLEKE